MRRGVTRFSGGQLGVDQTRRSVHWNDRFLECARPAVRSRFVQAPRSFRVTRVSPSYPRGACRPMWRGLQLYSSATFSATLVRISSGPAGKRLRRGAKADIFFDPFSQPARLMAVACVSAQVPPPLVIGPATNLGRGPACKGRRQRSISNGPH